MYLSQVTDREVRKRSPKIPERQRGEIERLLEACSAIEDDLEAPHPDDRHTVATHVELDEKLALEYVARMSGLRGAGGLVRLLIRGFLANYEQPKLAKGRTKKRRSTKKR